MIESWTDPGTGVLWLRDFLPKSISVARVLSFGYDASATTFHRAGCADTIQRHAHTLVANLEGDRNIEECSHRPIIFVCHGLGGIIVKKALAYSASRTSAQVTHLYTIFVSTYGILFFGTPHKSTDIAGWLKLESTKSSPALSTQDDGHFNSAIHGLENITDHFAPLMKNFHLFFFWEEVRTKIGHELMFLVEQSSAAPIVDNTERSGIYATHSDMIRFSNSNSSSYRTVVSALIRYSLDAPKVIARRWEVAKTSLAKERANEAFEISGLSFDIHQEPFSRRFSNASEKPQSKHFFPPPQTTSDFIGREDVLDTLYEALLPPDTIESTAQQRRFVIYGMGGSGKTQLCSKFARENQKR